MTENKQVKELIKKLESKTYQGEIISFSELKKYLERQDEDFWLDFELGLKTSRRKHTRKERVALTLKEFRRWRKEWQVKSSVARSNEKKVGEAGEVGEKVGQDDKKTKSTLNQSLINKVKKLVRELEDRVFKKKIIFKGELKRTLFQETEEFREEFEEQLKFNRKKDSKYRIPLTLQELQEWKREWEKLEVSPTSNFNFEEKKQKETNSSTLDKNKEIGEEQKENEPKSSILTNENSFGPFIYDLRNNKLCYQKQPIHWKKRSKMGGDWFENSQMRIYIQRLDNWNISVHAKIGLSLTYKAYFSCFKTDKMVLFFCPWNQVYQNEEGKWEKREDLEPARKFLEKYNLKMPDKSYEKKSKN